MVRSVTLPETYRRAPVPDDIYDIETLDEILSVPTKSTNAYQAASDPSFYNKCYYIAYHILAYIGRKMRFTLYTENGKLYLDITTSDLGYSKLGYSKLGYTFEILDYNTLQTLPGEITYQSNTDGFYSPQMEFRNKLIDLCNVRYACYDIDLPVVEIEGRDIEKYLQDPDPYTLSERGDKDIKHEGEKDIQNGEGCTIL